MMLESVLSRLPFFIFLIGFPHSIQGQLSRLNSENISLRKTFEARDESSATIKNGSVTNKVIIYTILN